MFVAGLAVAAKPKAVVQSPVVKAPEIPDPSEDGFVHLEKGVWSADRIRWCSFIEIGGAPERNGAPLTAQYEYASSVGASSKTWKFFDSNMQLTLTPTGSTCFANAKASLPEGKYRFPLQLETASVSTDPAQDAALAADPAWLTCLTTFPDRIATGFAIAVVVDTDERVWASDGTRDEGNLRDCLGTAATNWAKTLVESKTFPMAAPAVVYGRVLANATREAGTGSSISPRGAAKPAAPSEASAPVLPAQPTPPK